MSMPMLDFFSAADVRALPDDGVRYETVHGELLVTPAPGGMHQVVLGRLHFAMYRYLLSGGLEAVLMSPSDISFGADILVQPDLFVADLTEFERTHRWADIHTLHLAVEIVSPSSARTDRFTKRRLYQEQRIPVYWIVDIEQRHVEVWTPDAVFPVIERERVTWRHPLLSTECAMELASLFGGNRIGS